MALPEPPKSRSAPLPSRNPIPLSAAQEAQVKELYYKRVRGHCADQIRDFAACASGRTFSATWKCRQERLSMNGCMMAHAGQQEEDLAREEYFATADQRKAEREEKERKKAEQEKFFREWWDLDEKEKAQRKSRPS
ncbi:MAG: hypothetical protein OHK93_001453 [Ramalina farinacea]|uniref:COX assembly mitochondrial protein n=1 Tax=Ramalina farinacea TaxID=258253 RepID=A0AA43QSX4_9LECA|nr:hypothetical protein [Ramalina farinacea]